MYDEVVGVALTHFAGSKLAAAEIEGEIAIGDFMYVMNLAHVVTIGLPFFDQGGQMTVYPTIGVGSDSNLERTRQGREHAACSFAIHHCRCPPREMPEQHRPVRKPLQHAGYIVNGNIAGIVKQNGGAAAGGLGAEFALIFCKRHQQ